MMPSHISTCLLAGLAGFGSFLPPGQERPRRPQEGNPEQKRERGELLVQLPADFVQYARVPEGGQHPRIAQGKDHLQLLYYKGDGHQGDLYLARSEDEGKSFTSGVRLNPTPGSVVARSGAHTAALDLGPDGSAHVAWISAGEKHSLCYLRVPSGEAPAAPLDLGAPEGLCSTTALAVAGDGRIYLFYAASGAGDEAEGPLGRRVWFRASDDGKNFSEAIAIDREGHNVSTDSALAAHVDEVMGTVFAMHRTAYALKPESPSLSRGMRLLSSEDRGLEFKSTMVDNVKQVRDPRTSVALAQQKDTTLAVWDASGRVYWALVRRQLNKMNLPMEPRSDGEPPWRSHPAGAAAGNEVILAWLEQPADDRSAPPKVSWRVWYRDGRAPLGSGSAPETGGVAAPAVFARQAGGFTILY